MQTKTPSVGDMDIFCNPTIYGKLQGLKAKSSAFSTVLILVYTSNRIWPEVKVISDSSRLILS